MIGVPSRCHTFRDYLFGVWHGGRHFGWLVYLFGHRVGMNGDTVDPGSTLSTAVVPFLLVEYEDASLDGCVHERLVLVGGATRPLSHDAIDRQCNQVTPVGLGCTDVLRVFHEHCCKRRMARIMILCPALYLFDFGCGVRLVA